MGPEQIPRAPWWATIYVIIPIFSGLVWLAMLLAMLLWWVVKEHSKHLVPMTNDQYIAYISDIGAHQLQPLFIAMGSTAVVSFTTVFIYERWLRHKGTIARNVSTLEKVLAVLSIFFALAGMCGLITLTCKNNIKYDKIHDACLVLFIGGYILSAIFVCWEYQRLGIHYRQHRILRYSFWIKLAFIFVELGLAIAFGVLSDKAMYNSAAYCEWIISLIYTFYIWSYAIDFIPAVRIQHYHGKDHQETEIDMAQNEAAYDHNGARNF